VKRKERSVLRSGTGRKGNSHPLFTFGGGRKRGGGLRQQGPFVGNRGRQKSFSSGKKGAARIFFQRTEGGRKEGGGPSPFLSGGANSLSPFKEKREPLQEIEISFSLFILKGEGRKFG